MRLTLLPGIVGVALLAGCGLAVHACAGPAMPPPGIDLDYTPWAAAHRGDTLTACLDGRCRTVTAPVAVTSSGPHPGPGGMHLQLLLAPHTNPAAAMTLVVTGSTAEHHHLLEVTDRVPAEHHVLDGACTFSYWQTTVLLTAAGQLHVR